MEIFSIWQSALGIGAIEHLSQLRIRAACEALGDSTEQIADIAFACGYSCPSSSPTCHRLRASPFFSHISFKPPCYSSAAWLIRVDSNLCKNRLRFYKNHPKISVEQLSRYYEKEEDTLLMDSLLLLPFKYREVLLLHYVAKAIR